MGITERLRESMGDLTVEAFADLLEEKPQRIKDVLRGKQRLPEDLMIKLVARLGVDANWLLLGQPHAAQNLNVREKALLDNYRNSPEDGKRAAEVTLSALSKSKKTINSKN